MPATSRFPTEQFPSDQALLQGCKVGDAAAWNQLLNKYERLVFSIPISYGLSHDDASDIAQYVFTSLLQNLDALRDPNRLSAWLVQVARRRSWRLISQAKRTPTEDIDSDAAATLIADPTNPIARWEMMDWLNSGLNKIDERCRKLLLALYFEQAEPSYADVARQLGMAEGSIGPTRARCLQRLKDMMAES